MSKIRVSAVSYANSIPFVQGLIRSEVIQSIALSLDTPAICAQKLLDGSVDIGLVPVIIIPEMPYSEIVSGFCLGSDRDARTVLLVSEVPLQDIKTVILDADSRTSVILAQILARNHWHISPEWKLASDGFNPESVQGTTAAVVIGDKAFQVEGQHPVQYDLSWEWKKMTGLPFVFACWVANKELDITFLSHFNKALMDGVMAIDDAIAQSKESTLPEQKLKTYLTENISFILDDAKRKGMELFLHLKEQFEKEGLLVTR